MFSDYCLFLGTLFLSFKSYKIIQKKSFDKGNNLILPIIYVIIISFILSLFLLIFDRSTTTQNYRFDVRDRCSYWCWLNHLLSLVCYFFYTIIILFNISFYHKLNKCFLKENKKVNNDNDLMSRQVFWNDDTNEIKKENSIEQIEASEKSSQRQKIDELKLVKLKCFVYSIAVFIIWVVGIIYRLFDDIINYDVDSYLNSDTKEKEYFTNHPFVQFIVQFLLVLYTLVSSIRGLFYGILSIIETNKFSKIAFKDQNSNEKGENNELLSRSNNDIEGK